MVALSEEKKVMYRFTQTCVHKDNTSCVTKKLRLFEELNYLRKINSKFRLKDEYEIRLFCQFALSDLSKKVEMKSIRRLRLQNLT
jgi:hypothetical protein